MGVGPTPPPRVDSLESGNVNRALLSIQSAHVKGKNNKLIIDILKNQHALILSVDLENGKPKILSTQSAAIIARITHITFYKWLSEMENSRYFHYIHYIL